MGWRKTDSGLIVPHSINGASHTFPGGAGTTYLDDTGAFSTPAGVHPNLATHDAMGLSTDAELATHAGLTDVHHAKLHQADHASGGADEITNKMPHEYADDVGAAVATRRGLQIRNNDGAILFAYTDLGGVTDRVRIGVDHATTHVLPNAHHDQAHAQTGADHSNIASARILGRVTAGAGATEELTGTQATTLLDLFTTLLKGLVPASGGGTTNFLRADGTWNAPPGGAPVGAQYVVMVADATLTSERVLTPGVGLDLVDGGAGAAATLDIDTSEFTQATDMNGFDDTFPYFDTSAVDERKVTGWDTFLGQFLRRAWWIYDDFLAGDTFTTTRVVKELVAFFTGAGSQMAPTVGSNSHPGILRMSAGTTATGHARLVGSTSGIDQGGRIRAGCWIRVPTLSVAAQRFGVYFGLMDQVDPYAAAGSRIIVRLKDDINGGRWEGSCRGAAETTLDLGIAAVANTWYFLEWQLNANLTSVEFFIDGVSKGTIATNVPTAACEPRMGILKTVGVTSRDVDFDGYYMYGELTTAR